MNGLLAAAQPTLGLKSLDVGTPVPARGRQETVIATLEAQPTGLFAWIRRVCGFGRSISLMLTTARVIRMTRGRNEEHATSVPLSALASTHYDYSKPATKLIAGLMMAIGGLVGVFVVGPMAVVGLLVGGAITAWHFLSGPKFTVHFDSVNSTTLMVKVDAGQSTQRLVQFAEAIAEQLRVNAQQVQAAAPPPAPGTAAGFPAARA
jgi:hypothetical protein